jgi:uncharacterized protein involved in exopolysaccharide biosynthesis
MNQDNDNTLTVHVLWKDILAVLRRRRKLVLWTAAGTIAAVYLGLLFVSDKYEAQASLLVTLGRENTEVPVTVERGTVINDGVKKEEVTSEIALLTSRPLLLAAVDEVGPERFAPQPDRSKTMIGHVKYFAKRCVRQAKAGYNEVLTALALRPRLSQRELAFLAVQRNLDAYRDKDSSVIQLTLRLPDPVLGRDVLDALIKQHLQRHAEVTGQADSVVKVFEDQARNDGQRLEQLRDQAASLKEQLGVSSVEGQKAQLLEMLKTAELGRQSSELELAQLKAEETAVARRRPQLDEQLVTSQVVSPSIARTRLKELLADLRLRRAEALAKYDPDADPVKKIEEQIAGAEALTNQFPDEDNGPRTYSRNPVVAHMDFQEEEGRVRMATLEAGVAEAKRQIAGIKSDLLKLDHAETELQKLELEINVVQTRYLANASKREEARAEETMDRARVANVSVLSPPSSGELPVAPKRLLIMALGVFAGVCGGLGLGLFLEWQSDVIHDERDLERFLPRMHLGSLTAEEKTPVHRS